MAHATLDYPPLDVITNYLVIGKCHILDPCNHAMSTRTYEKWVSETQFHDYCPFCYEPGEVNQRITSTSIFDLTQTAKQCSEENGYQLNGLTMVEIETGHKRMLDCPRIFRTRYANPGCELPVEDSIPDAFWLVQLFAISTVVDTIFRLHKI